MASTSLHNFLEKNTPPNRKEEIKEDFKFKVHYLDNVGRTKGHKYNHKAKKRKRLTCKEKHKLKLFKLDKDDQEYELYLPLHQLWQDYARDLLQIDKLNAKNQVAAANKLLKADYHGAEITVIASRCPSLIGHKGIVVMETKQTFQIIKSDNTLKILPKKGTNFTLTLDGYEFTIYGSQFQIKPCMRVVAKNFRKYEKSGKMVTIDL